MNFKQAALFLYGVSMLEDRIHNGSKIDQTLYVWSYGSAFLPPTFMKLLRCLIRAKKSISTVKHSLPSFLKMMILVIKAASCTKIRLFFYPS
ncbi:MAG: hypothetical protein DUD32_05985 [Lactobacillus sp.]|nr:MAG: hypothetical protein DUD32_05985 [Lactobacillus sp.]